MLGLLVEVHVVFTTRKRRLMNLLTPNECGKCLKKTERVKFNLSIDYSHVNQISGQNNLKLSCSKVDVKF